MLELAALLFGMTWWVPGLGPEYADIGASAFRISEILFVAWCAISLVALFMYRPHERRVLHHA